MQNNRMGSSSGQGCEAEHVSEVQVGEHQKQHRVRTLWGCPFRDSLAYAYEIRMKIRGVKLACVRTRAPTADTERGREACTSDVYVYAQSFRV
jgi:hypothetical protein